MHLWGAENSQQAGSVNPANIRSMKQRFAFLILLGAFTLLATSAARAAADIQSKIDAIRQSGEPVSYAELNNWIGTVPDSQNAALAFNNAFAAIVKSSDNAWPKLPARTMNLPPSTLTALRAVLTENKTARDKLHQAATLKQAHYPIDWSAGPVAKMPHLAKAKVAFELLRLESAIMAEGNRADLAANSVQTGLALARSLESEPVLISQLVRVAGITMMASAAERLLCQRSLNDAPLTGLQTAFAAPDKPEIFPRTIATERCFGLGLMQAPPDEMLKLMNGMIGEGIGQEVNAEMKTMIAKTKDESLRIYLDEMGAYLAASKVLAPQCLDEMRRPHATAGAELEDRLAGQDVKAVAHRQRAPAQLERGRRGEPPPVRLAAPFHRAQRSAKRHAASVRRAWRPTICSRVARRSWFCTHVGKCSLKRAVLLIHQM